MLITSVAITKVLPCNPLKFCQFDFKKPAHSF